MRFSDPLFVEQRQRTLHARNSTLERHFSEQKIFDLRERYGLCTGQFYIDAFMLKREKMSEAFDLFLTELDPDSSFEDIILEAGRAFEYVNISKETFDIDIWVIADFLLGLHLKTLGGQSHEQVAELIGSEIAKWLRGDAAGSLNEVRPVDRLSA